MDFVGKKCYICRTSSDKLFDCPRIKSSVLLWLEALGIDKKNACAAAATLKLCRKHFHASDFIDSEQNQLNRSAIPSLYLGNQGSSAVFPSTSLMTDVSDIPINKPSTAVFPSSSWTVTPSASTSTGVTDLPINSSTLEKSQYKSQSNASVIKETPLVPAVSEKSRKSHLIFIRQLRKMMPKTLRTKKFLNILRRKLKDICTLKRVCMKNEQDLKELFIISSEKYVDIIFKDLSTKNQLLLISQLCVKDVATSGRQWTVDEKLTCLIFWKRYPKVYRLLRKLIVLPSINCLMTLLRLIPLRPGVHDCIRSHLKNMTRNLWKTEKFCSLMFDEMSIREGLSFDQKTDRITGHVDMGTGLKGKEYANSVIVFMLQGLERDWKQPIAYYFCRNLTSDHLSRMIMEVIRQVYSIGLRVVCTVCDMKNNNVKALNSLKSKKEDHFFGFKGKTIFTMFNPPSLLVSTRNLLYKYNIHCEFSLKGTSYVGEARWADIRAVYELDLPSYIRTLEKLTEAHLAPVNKNTMMAANVLSYKVVSTMSFFIRHGWLPDTAMVTAIFVNTVDSLFDSLNATRLIPKDWKELKCCVSKTSKHMRFWEETESAINSWVYLDKSGQPFTPSSKTGWIITLRAIRGIWKYLKAKGLCHLPTRNFNIDPLEHLFYLIRSCSGGNNRPTAEQFESAYKLYVNNNIKKFEVCRPVQLYESPYSILRGNELKFLSDFQPFFQNPVNKQDVREPNTVAEESPDFSTTVFPSVESAACGERHILSVAYIASFIVRRILEKQNCNSCIKSLMSDCTDSLCNRFFELKDYKDNKTSFICPTEDIVIAVGNAVTIVEKMLPDIFNTADIFKQLSTVINTAVDFSFLCATHKEIMRSCIIKGVCFISVPWYCKREMRRLVDRNCANKQKFKRT